MLAVIVKYDELDRDVRWIIYFLGWSYLFDAFAHVPGPAMGWTYMGVVLKAGIVVGLLFGLTAFLVEIWERLRPTYLVAPVFCLAFAFATVYRIRFAVGDVTALTYMRAVPEMLWWIIVAMMCVGVGWGIFEGAFYIGFRFVTRERR